MSGLSHDGPATLLCCRHRRPASAAGTKGVDQRPFDVTMPNLDHMDAFKLAHLFLLLFLGGYPAVAFSQAVSSKWITKWQFEILLFLGHVAQILFNARDSHFDYQLSFHGRNHCHQFSEHWRSPFHSIRTFLSCGWQSGATALGKQQYSYSEMPYNKRSFSHYCDICLLLLLKNCKVFIAVCTGCLGSRMKA